MEVEEVISIKCGECKTGDGVEWHSSCDTNGVVDGRLSLNDVRPIFYAGCEFCGETIKVLRSDEVAMMLTDLTHQKAKKLE